MKGNRCKAICKGLVAVKVNPPFQKCFETLSGTFGIPGIKEPSHWKAPSV